MLSDQPITSAKDDLLGRAAFARQIASAMLACPPGKRSSFTIGLCGGWGSGKTSVLNMVVEALQSRAVKGRRSRPAPIVVRFNPWQYPAAELLPGQFLGTLAAELGKPAHGERLNKAAKAMAKYAAVMETCAPGIRIETVAELRGAPPKKQKEGKLPRSVMARKAKVFRQLQKQKQKIYVIMDDIDRLSPRRIRHALQLVNAVAGFPRMVYLLSFDQEVVAGALGKEMNGDGWEYLKKFIQVQFAMPAPEVGRIHDILNAYFETWLQSQKDLNFDRAYFMEIAPFLFKCIASIRDVYRFVNTFRFQYQALGNEVNFVDLLAVTALQLHIPQALPWIQAHKEDLLRGGGITYQSANTAHRQALKKEHMRMLRELSEPNANTLVQLIGHMFPRYGANVLDVHGDDFDPRFVRMRRICCEEFFDLYFTLSTDSLVITQQEILKTIREMDAAELRKFTGGLTRDERRDAYLNHLPHYLDDISPKKLPMFFAEVVWLSRLPEGKMPHDKPFQRSFFHECCYCALRILARMDGDVRKQCLQEAVGKADRQSIPILVTVLQRILRRNPDADSVEIDDDTVRAYLRRLLDKIVALASDGGWLDLHKPLPVLEYWKQADAVSFRVYMERLLKDDSNAARLVSCLMQRFDRDANMEYQYGDIDGMHAFSEEFPQPEAKAAVLRLMKTDAFRALPLDVRLDCAAFSLMDETVHRVAHRDVLEAYPAYKNENREIDP